MIVQFLVGREFDEYVSDLPYEIVDSNDDEFGGYDIFQVRTEDVSKIRIVNTKTGIEYMAEKVQMCKDGYYVTVWNPINRRETNEKNK